MTDPAFQKVLHIERVQMVHRTPSISRKITCGLDT